MGQSKTLEDFYTAYAKWLMRGAKEGNVFSRTQGLCNNLYRWLVAAGLTTDWSVQHICQVEMTKQFMDAGLCTLSPFNADLRQYIQESRNKDCHLNELRLKWVAEHARDLRDK